MLYKHTLIQNIQSFYHIGNSWSQIRSSKVHILQVKVYKFGCFENVKYANYDSIDIIYSKSQTKFSN